MVSDDGLMPPPLLELIHLNHIELLGGLSYCIMFFLASLRNLENVYIFHHHSWVLILHLEKHVYTLC